MIEKCVCVCLDLLKISKFSFAVTAWLEEEVEHPATTISLKRYEIKTHVHVPFTSSSSLNVFRFSSSACSSTPSPCSDTSTSASSTLLSLCFVVRGSISLKSFTQRWQELDTSISRPITHVLYVSHRMESTMTKTVIKGT